MYVCTEGICMKRKRVIKAFEGHEGRPGMVGGSLPRGATAGDSEAAASNGKKPGWEGKKLAWLPRKTDLLTIKQGMRVFRYKPLEDVTDEDKPTRFLNLATNKVETFALSKYAPGEITIRGGLQRRKERRIVHKAFPGHKGRPGLVGGSAPLGAGWEERARAHGFAMPSGPVSVPTGLTLEQKHDIVVRAHTDMSGLVKQSDGSYEKDIEAGGKMKLVYDLREFNAWKHDYSQVDVIAHVYLPNDAKTRLELYDSKTLWSSKVYRREALPPSWKDIALSKMAKIAAGEKVTFGDEAEAKAPATKPSGGKKSGGQMSFWKAFPGHAGRPGMVGGSVPVGSTNEPSAKGKGVVASYDKLMSAHKTPHYWILSDGTLVDNKREDHDYSIKPFANSANDAIANGAIRVSQHHWRVYVNTQSYDTSTLRRLQDLVYDKKIDFTKDGMLLWDDNKETGGKSFDFEEFMNAKYARIVDGEVVLKAFPGHAGRPGMVGGSTPRGAEVEDKTTAAHEKRFLGDKLTKQDIIDGINNITTINVSKIKIYQQIRQGAHGSNMTFEIQHSYDPVSKGHDTIIMEFQHQMPAHIANLYPSSMYGVPRWWLENDAWKGVAKPIVDAIKGKGFNGLRLPVPNPPEYQPKYVNVDIR